MFNDNEKKSFNIRALVFGGIAIALSYVTAEVIPSIKLPFGGAITLFSMFFIVFVSHIYGCKLGLPLGVAFGLINFISNPIFLSIPQVLLDYIIAYGALGLAGLFRTKKNGLLKGYLLAVTMRYLSNFLAGVIFWRDYAPDGMPVAIYSASYQALYIVPEALVTCIVISLPPTKKAFEKIKSLC